MMVMLPVSVEGEICQEGAGLSFIHISLGSINR